MLEPPRLVARTLRRRLHVQAERSTCKSGLVKSVTSRLPDGAEPNTEGALNCQHMSRLPGKTHHPAMSCHCLGSGFIPTQKLNIAPNRKMSCPAVEAKLSHKKGAATKKKRQDTLPIVKNQDHSACKLRPHALMLDSTSALGL